MSQPTTGHVVSASKLTGGDVKNSDGEKLGDIKEIMIDRRTGHVAYAVLDFGGFLGMGDKYFAIPWSALQTHITEPNSYVLNVTKERLTAAPGFDKKSWPDFADRKWGGSIFEYYSLKPYW
jgi:sporulation protein YlmC with PRC-barrel domain